MFAAFILKVVNYYDLKIVGHLEVRATECHITSMRYQLKIMHRGRPPRPYGWEIYDLDDPRMPVDKSKETFKSRKAAMEAGDPSLMKWLDGTRKRRIR